MKKIDLDNVMLSQRIVSTWLAYVTQEIIRLKVKYTDLAPAEIADEFLVIEKGKAFLVAKVRSSVLKLAVPNDEYKLV